MESEILVLTADVEKSPFDWTSQPEWLTRVARGFGWGIDLLHIVLCTDEFLLQMNQDHLGHDYYTDIITFDDSYNEQVRAELFISVDRIIDNADKSKVKVEDEFDRVIVHGLLHCIGFMDKTDKEAAEMRRQEELALAIR